MESFIDNHPIAFTVLAFPVVVTACAIVAGMLGVEFRWRR